MHHTRFLRYVDEVARAGSIRRAAERLHVASSAVNRRILDLEAELGTPIFERLPRGVRLTAAGEIFLAYVRRRMADLRRAQSEIEDLRGLRRGSVSIAATQATAHGFLPDAIVEFRRRFPGIAFKVKVCDREEAVRAVTDLEVEAALVFNPPAVPEFKVRAELPQRLCALVAPGHPLSKLTSVRLRECLDYPIALPDASLGGRGLFEDYFARVASRITPQLESNSFELMRNFARVSRGVCFQIQIGATGGPGGLVSVPLDERDLKRGRLVLGSLRGHVLPVAASLFCEFLAERLQPAKR